MQFPVLDFELDQYGSESFIYMYVFLVAQCSCCDVIFDIGQRVPYSGKLLSEKTSNFTALWLFMKVFSVKFGGVASSFCAAKASNL